MRAASRRMGWGGWIMAGVVITIALKRYHTGREERTRSEPHWSERREPNSVRAIVRDLHLGTSTGSIGTPEGSGR